MKLTMTMLDIQKTKILLQNHYVLYFNIKNNVFLNDNDVKRGMRVNQKSVI